MDQPMDIVERAPGNETRFDHFRVDRIVGRRGQRHVETQRERRQRLARVVVQLAREAPPLVFLRRDHLAQEARTLPVT